VQLGPLTVGARLNADGARVIDPKSAAKITAWLRGSATAEERAAFSLDFLRWSRVVGVPT
jgi:hypothetical protein